MVGVAAGFSCIRGSMRACLSTQGVGGIFIVGGTDFCCGTFFFFFFSLSCAVVFYVFCVCSACACFFSYVRFAKFVEGHLKYYRWSSK